MPRSIAALNLNMQGRVQKEEKLRFQSVAFRPSVLFLACSETNSDTIAFGTTITSVEGPISMKVNLSESLNLSHPRA